MTWQLVSGDSVAAVIVVSGMVARILLPHFGAALSELPEWGLRMHAWRETVRTDRERRRANGRRARAARRRRRRG